MNALRRPGLRLVAEAALIVLAAGPDGVLPIDFDALVRESFGDLLGTPAA